jgi:hypothetical protein
LKNDHRELWRHHDRQCVMISCCAGAELQVRRIAATRVQPGEPDGDDILLRELYPTKSDLYERARMLLLEYQQLNLTEIPRTG